MLSNLLLIIHVDEKLGLSSLMLGLASIFFTQEYGKF